MKKIFVLFSFIFISPVFAETVNDFTNMCGVVGYRRLYAVPQSFMCESGFFLPANATTCAPCPDGYTCPGGTFDFNSTHAQGLNTNQTYISPTAYGKTCASNIVARRMYSVPQHFTCSSGYFLPASSPTCAPCPDGYTCPGGTFEFSMTSASGLIIDTDNPYITYDIKNTCAINSGRIMNGAFTPNVHNCAPGYYLPAYTDECIICPRNNKCVGGTYTFNETETQGIEACANPTPFAPVGSNICYEHILHIGDEMIYLKSNKTTFPSLNIGWNGDVFYANMTTVPTIMSIESERYLKMNVDGTLYYVCDDSTYNK